MVSPNDCRLSRWLFVLLLTQILFGLGISFVTDEAGAAGSYQPVASRATTSFRASSFLLPDGRALLLAGASGTGTPARGGEIYDPFTDSWSATAQSVGRDESTATRLADGRVLMAGGRVDGPVSAEIYDPASDSWQLAGEMATWRVGHAAVLLADGRVLVTGGNDEYGSPLATSELYDPVSNSWSPAPAMAQVRVSHTATLLPGGKVLVAGGALTPDVPSAAYSASAELFDPVAGTWSPAASLSVARGFHRATVVPGGKVLVTGGMTPEFTGIQQAEIYDPAAAVWTSAGNLAYGRFYHSATVLNDGKVLVAGGDSYGSGYPGSTTELFDPATGTWETDATLSESMTGPTATLMLNGQVLLTGGFQAQPPVPAGLYTPAGLDPASPRVLSLTMTASGSVRSTPAGIDCLEGLCSAGFPYGLVIELVASETPGQVFTGWSGCNAAALNKCTVTMSADKSVTAHFAAGPARFLPAANIEDAYESHTATLISGGKVLVTGGLFTAATYDPVANSWSDTSHTYESRRIEPHTATMLTDGKVLVVGGEWTQNYGYPCGEIYDPVADGWEKTAPTIFGDIRHRHTATLLPSGKVLVAGGAAGLYLPDVLADAEIYSPSTNGWDGGQWQRVAALSKARHSHTATPIPGGRVLVVGGTGASGSALSSVEIFDAVTNLWRAGAPLAIARSGHSATLLPDGRVLVVGGLGAAGVVASAEIFDPVTNSWSSAGALAAPRTRHATALQPNGRILVAGGIGAANASLSSAELYDPATGEWTLAEPLIDARADHTATPLKDGRTLVLAGVEGTRSLSTAEVYGPGQLPEGDTSAPSSFMSSVSSDVLLEVTGTATDGTGTGVRRVEISLDGGSTWTAVTGTLNWSYKPGPLPNGQYNIVTRAVDYAGNVEPLGTAVSATIAAPLAVAIETPVQDAAVPGPALTVSGTASCSWWINKVEVTFDGGATWHLASGRRSWFFTLPPLPAGTRTIQAKAYDEAGNVVMSTPVTFDITPDDASGVVPEASFSASVVDGYAPFIVTLRDTSLDTPTSWLWEFGDGGRSSERNPVHTFQEPGSYPVKLTVANSAGAHVRNLMDYVLVKVCPNLPVRTSSGSSFGSIQDAFDTASADSAVFVQAKSFTGDVVLSREVSLVLKGGYDCGYTMNPVAATMRGNLKLVAGTLKVENLVFR